MTSLDLTDRMSFDPTAFVREQGGEKRLTLRVQGARCGACLSKIENGLTALPGVKQARLNLTSGKLDVIWTGAVTAKRIANAVTDLGFQVQAHDESAGDAARQAEEKSLLIALGVAGFATANIMLLSVSVWADAGEMGETTRQSLHALSGLIAFPTIAFSGQPFFRSAFAALRRGRANMDVPISLAVTLAFGVSAYETLTGGVHAYFDAACMLLFFLLIGRLLEARVRRQAYAAAHQLAALASRTATRIDGSGRAESVRASILVPGDRILLASGERAGVDVIIEEGHSEVDESLVTGESLPRDAVPGMTLSAGTVNLTHPLRGRVLNAAEDSLMADLGRMLEAGEQRRSSYRRLADKAVSFYVPVVHTTALLAFLGWFLSGAGVHQAIMIAVSTLIITCPCALALAAPVAQVVAAGKLFRNGIYLKSGDALERFASADHIVFDKTGTLTLGVQRLVSSHIAADLESAATLARASRHPLSRALVVAAGKGLVAADVREFPGQGLEGRVNGVVCRLGSAAWVGGVMSSTRGPALYFARDGEAPVEFRFEDELKVDAHTSISQLETLGFNAEILSGDQPVAVARAAEKLGIAHWQAGMQPQDKVSRLDTLRAAGRNVLMVGDGLNDAGALAQAHAAVVPGGAIGVSQSASDAVFAGGLSALPQLIMTARATRRVMLQNFWFAALYNAVAVPIALMGLATPLVAAVAMSGSSLIVCLNALRLNRVQRVAS